MWGIPENKSGHAQVVVPEQGRYFGLAFARGGSFQNLEATIQAARSLYPGKKLTGIFQPHLFTRTRDFADAFATALYKLDACILLPIYPARELPLPGVTSEMLLDKMTLTNKQLVQKAELLNELKTRQPEVLLTMGAGDIDTMIEPIRQSLIIS